MMSSNGMEKYLMTKNKPCDGTHHGSDTAPECNLDEITAALGAIN